MNTKQINFKIIESNWLNALTYLTKSGILTRKKFYKLLSKTRLRLNIFTQFRATGTMIWGARFWIRFTPTFLRLKKRLFVTILSQHTHACVLFVRESSRGRKLISVAGAPYDTMEEVIGKRGDKRASLMGHGVLYDENSFEERNGCRF